jgi:hypothetical protein
MRLNSYKWNMLAVLCLLTVLMTGCQHKINIAQPIPPVLTPPPVEDSTLSTVTSIRLGSVCKQLDGLIPHPIAENPGHPCFQYGVYQHTPLTCGGNANVFTASFQVAYKAGQRCGVAGVGQASCGFDSERYATVASTAMISWDHNWHANVIVTPHITLDSACNITAANINVNSFVLGKIQPTADDLAGQAPGKVAAITDIKGKATNMWSTLNQPLSLGDNLWLMLHPKTVMAANPDLGADNAITLSAGMSAQPEVIVSPTAPPASNTPLPPLQNGPISNQFHVALVGSLSWDDATKLLSSSFAGKQYKAGPLHNIILDHVNVLGNGNTMIVAVGVTGNINGTVYLQGTPTYVRSRNGKPVEEIEVPDLEFTPETRNVLAASAAWVLHSTIRDELRAKAVFPLGHRLTDLRTKLEAGLNRQLAPGISLTGKITDLTLRGVYLSNNAVTVQAVANGTTQVMFQ